MMTTTSRNLKTLRPDAKALAASCPGLNSRLIARRMTQVFDRALAGTGLSLAQIGLLAQIAAAEDDTISALARLAGLEASTLSRNLRLLETAGLVEIAAVERDLRRRAVWLTEAGAVRLESALPLWRRAQAECDASLSAALANLVARLAEADAGAA